MYSFAYNTVEPTCPDCVGASLLMNGNNAWSVTRQYLVSHSIEPPSAGGAGAAMPLTTSRGGGKHLPRCFEPHRRNWRKRNAVDQFGWDYYNYDECDPTKHFVYPCHNLSQVAYNRAPLIARPANMTGKVYIELAFASRASSTIRNGDTKLGETLFVGNPMAKEAVVRRQEWLQEHQKHREK